MICTGLSVRLTGFVEARRPLEVFPGAAMSQVMRQIGVVIGLTMILTFPVTVVSGAGSQKQSDHIVRKPAAQWSPAQVDGVSPVEITASHSWREIAQ